MNNQEIIIKELLNNIKNNNNAIIEIKKHTEHFLNQHENDNLLELIKSATLRGYSGIEWIDFWGVGGVDLDIIISSAYNIIRKQNLETIIEPYYNNINHRLGITINRCYYKEKLKSLPIELQNVTNKSKECYNIPEEKNYSKNDNTTQTKSDIENDIENDTSLSLNANIKRNIDPLYNLIISDIEKNNVPFYNLENSDTEKDELCPSFSILDGKQSVSTDTSNLSIIHSHFDKLENVNQIY